MKVRSGRSLKASPAGIKRANKAVLVFPTKIDLAAELEISRATVQNFFAGKPVGRENFHKICQKLQLPWRDIADLPEDALPEPCVAPKNKDNNKDNNDYDIDALVQELRGKAYNSIVMRCGMMRVLDMSQPIGLNEIYTNIHIQEKITGRRRIGIADLQRVCGLDDFERPEFASKILERISALEALKKYSKLIVLGKPGSGKTTFLKCIALQCINGKLAANRVPIYITLKDFAETEKNPSLVEYICQQFSTYGVGDTAVTKEVLLQGRALVLLDGLDEVRETDSPRVLKEVRDFADRFHSNRFVLTSRIAAREYTFEQFTEVEIADFDDAAIATFVRKWFAAIDPTNSNSSKFIEKLQENSRLRELATNPLLLTLLCLMFEDSADFPWSHPELYKEGLNLLLKKWDAKRNIEREQAYKKLSVQHKENLLSQIALISFEQGDYFFSQKEIEQHIVDYIRHLPGDSAQLKELHLDSEAILKSIEAQHGLLVERSRGIYSFSHLTFLEYFAAKEIVAASDPQALETALKQLVGHITEKRWRQIFLLTVAMLRNADYLLLLMKQQIDQLLAKDQHLQGFLAWVNQKSLSVRTECKPAMVRACYLDLAVASAFDLAGGSYDLARSLDPNLCCAVETLIIEHRNIGHDWRFSNQQRLALKQYYDANRLLIDCLNSNCYATLAARHQIEATLLQPVADMEGLSTAVVHTAQGTAYAQNQMVAIGS